MHCGKGVGFFFMFAHVGAGTCACGGYSMPDPRQENKSLLFAESLSTDFSAIRDVSQSADWVRQEFNVSAEAGRGRFGKSFLPDNVFLLPQEDVAAGKGTARHGQTVMALRVASRLTESGAVTSAEMDTSRRDLFWGSFRAMMKLARVAGTCAAFFWVWWMRACLAYMNDTQEIDMEFLSREFDVGNRVFPVNLVVHSWKSLRDGYDASKSGTLKRVNLAFDPTDDFHEYRFDYLPGLVTFYADGKQIAELTGSDVPSSGGHLILQHWSNGNPTWSGGPPSSDAVALVRYVKAYFNSSNPNHHQDAQGQEGVCRASNDASRNMCPIPEGNSTDNGQGDQASPPDDGAGGRSQENDDDDDGGSSDESDAARPPAMRWIWLVAIGMMGVTDG
ncbi:hypothetical protein UVI_02048050 [Ustilaginoidea virens]|uniref:GH16 domain-containing protein n=1 Tax=Ustilaginoidea virens TaxID=1159556 RepID=A0A1B5KZ94_USTVR|nr:hypothetical protein UVI_02048050 [Ustilaginoidea virens]